MRLFEGASQRLILHGHTKTLQFNVSKRSEFEIQFQLITLLENVGGKRLILPTK